MARRAGTRIPQPCEVPLAPVPVLPLDLNPCAFRLHYTDLRRRHRLHRKPFTLVPGVPLRLLRAHNFDSFVAHLPDSFVPTPRSYFTFSISIPTLNPNVTELDAIIGIDPSEIPYTSHNSTPAENIENVGSEISRADRSFSTRISCGTNAAVVKKAATNPTGSTHRASSGIIHS